MSSPTTAPAEDAWHYPWGEPEYNRVSRFFSSLAKSKIETTKCKRCSTVQWPPRSICSKCLSLDLGWVALPKRGTLVAFSQAYVGTSPGESVPMTVGVIHLPGGIRLLSRIVDADFGSLRIGMPVKFLGARLMGGKPYWEFTPGKPQAGGRRVKT